MVKHLDSTLGWRRQLLGRGPRALLFPFPVPSLTRRVWGLWSQGPLHAPAPLSTIQVHQSLLSHPLAFSFLCSFLNWYLWHTGGRVHGGRSAPVTLMKMQASLALVCLPSPARTTGISHCFRQVAQPVCTHTLTCTLRPETCFFKPTDLHSPISQPSKCRMPLAAELPIKTCFLGHPLCPRAARLCPAFAHLCQHSQAPLRLDSRDTTSVRPPWVSAGRLLPFPQCSQLCPEPAVTVYLHKYLVTLMSYVGEAQLTRASFLLG